MPAITVLRAPQSIPAAAAEMRDAQPARSNAALDILIAEDNEVNQLVFGQILSGLGLQLQDRRQWPHGRRNVPHIPAETDPDGRLDAGDERL